MLAGILNLHNTNYASPTLLRRDNRSLAIVMFSWGLAHVLTEQKWTFPIANERLCNRLPALFGQVPWMLCFLHTFILCLDNFQCEHLAEIRTTFDVITAGVEGEVIVQKLLGLPFEVGYNAMIDKVENLVEAGVIDPAKVTRNGLLNATSIAGILLTTQVGGRFTNFLG